VHHQRRDAQRGQPGRPVRLRDDGGELAGDAARVVAPVPRPPRALAQPAQVRREAGGARDGGRVLGDDVDAVDADRGHDSERWRRAPEMRTRRRAAVGAAVVPRAALPLSPPAKPAATSSQK
jgi:hypothetical protein